MFTDCAERLKDRPPSKLIQPQGLPELGAACSHQESPLPGTPALQKSLLDHDSRGKCSLLGPFLVGAATRAPFLLSTTVV